MTPFAIHGSRAHRGECYRKIRQAYNNIIRRRAESGTRSCGTSPSYRTWLRDRTGLIGLLGGHDQRMDQEAHIEELEDTLEQMRVEQGVLKRKLEVALEDAHQERQ
ncbi:hypothetical protein CR513_27909, partial [Mucuna pruriens]